MLLISGLLVALAAVLAYANGGNDVAKGIATLVGSGVSSFRLDVLRKRIPGPADRDPGVSRRRSSRCGGLGPVRLEVGTARLDDARHRGCSGGRGSRGAGGRR